MLLLVLSDFILEMMYTTVSVMLILKLSKKTYFIKIFNNIYNTININYSYSVLITGYNDDAEMPYWVI